MKESRWSNIFNLVKIPVLVTLFVFIVGAGIGLFLDSFSLVLPLVIVALVSSIITCFLFKSIVGKLYKTMVKLVDNDIPSKDFRGSWQLGEIYTVFKELVQKYNGLRSYMDKSSDEIKKSFEEVSNLSEKSFSDINKIFGSIDEISEPVSTQADELEICTDKVNELSDYLDSINNNYGSILKNADEIKGLSNQGLSSIEKMQDKFQATLRIFEEISESIENFEDILKQIDEFVDIIGAIGGKTDLLALNASIEASKAGESGQGFAVVAGEFKKLSKQSNSSAAHVRNLIQNVDEQYNRITVSLKSLEDAINEQSGSVEETVEAFNNIANAEFSILNEMNGVNESLKKMDDDKSEVLKLISNTSELSQKTVDSSENIATIIAYHVQTVTDIFNYVKKFGDLISGFNTENPKECEAEEQEQEQSQGDSGEQLEYGEDNKVQLE